MTEHERFKQLLEKIEMDYRELAELLGFTYDSVKSMLSPAKTFPRWAKSMLIVADRMERKKKFGVYKEGEMKPFNQEELDFLKRLLEKLWFWQEKGPESGKVQGFFIF